MRPQAGTGPRQGSGARLRRPPLIYSYLPSGVLRHLCSPGRIGLCRGLSPRGQELAERLGVAQVPLLDTRKQGALWSVLTFLGERPGAGPVSAWLTEATSALSDCPDHRRREPRCRERVLNLGPGARSLLPPLLNLLLCPIGALETGLNLCTFLPEDFKV